MDKRYYAILKGQLTDKVTHVKAPLHKYVAANGERRVVVAHEGEGQSAHTQFNVDQIAGGYTAVRVKIFTGRTHQTYTARRSSIRLSAMTNTVILN